MYLYLYNVFRLILIAVILTYFIGCFWFWVSLNQLEWFADPNTTCITNTWYTNFGLEDRNLRCQIYTSCYFALTTLSTVGYGDYYPISWIEMIFSVVIMLLGVAFFSYIIGNFIEIISTYEAKVGIVDRREDLNRWLISLQRFKNRQPLTKSLQV